MADSQKYPNPKHYCLAFNISVVFVETKLVQIERQN